MANYLFQLFIPWRYIIWGFDWYRINASSNILNIILYTLITMIWGACYGPSPKREVFEIFSLVLMICCAGKGSIEVIELGSNFGGVASKL